MIPHLVLSNHKNYQDGSSAQNDYRLSFQTL